MNNTVLQDYHVDCESRSKLKNHKPKVVWFTGLSGSGKSTIANLVEKKLCENNIHTYSLDGDNIRRGINKDLGFTAEDRSENLRRISEVANLFADAGLVVLAAFITPLNKDRDFIKQTVGKENFIEIFINTTVEECERRDVKGLYAKARAGEIKNFTGISAPFEHPENHDLTINTEQEDPEAAVERIIKYLEPKIRLAENE